MPKYRQLHTKIIDSFDFNNMPDDFTRVVWLLLIVVVDSGGRAIDNPAWLRSKMFPMRSDVELDRISAVIDWLETNKMIIRYEVETKKCFYIPSFQTYQTGTEKEAKSYLPAPSELLRSYSGVGTELLRVNTIQYNTNTDTTQRDSNFIIYEQEIGQVTPFIADAIENAEKEYPAEWIPKAIRLAAANNVRKMSYVTGILKKWKLNGFEDSSSKQDAPKTMAVLVTDDAGNLILNDEGRAQYKDVEVTA